MAVPFTALSLLGGTISAPQTRSFFVVEGAPPTATVALAAAVPSTLTVLFSLEVYWLRALVVYSSSSELAWPVEPAAEVGDRVGLVEIAGEIARDAEIEAVDAALDRADGRSGLLIEAAQQTRFVE